MAKRIVDSDLWADKKFRKEIRTFKARYLWVYLLTNAHCQSIGIYTISFDDMAYETLLSEDEVRQCLMQLTDLRLCDYDIETEEIVIFNFPKYNIASWGKPMVDKIKSELSNVKNTRFIERMAKYLKAYMRNQPNDKKALLIERVVPLFDEALKPLEEKEREVIKEKDNNTYTYNNININNGSCHDTSNDTSKNNDFQPLELSEEDKEQWDSMVNQLSTEDDNNIQDETKSIVGA